MLDFGCVQNFTNKWLPVDTQKCGDILNSHQLMENKCTFCKLLFKCRTGKSQMTTLSFTEFILSNLIKYTSAKLLFVMRKIKTEFEKEKTPKEFRIEIEPNQMNTESLQP